jgi:hypothetical protein
MAALRRHTLKLIEPAGSPPGWVHRTGSNGTLVNTWSKLVKHQHAGTLLSALTKAAGPQQLLQLFGASQWVRQHMVYTWSNLVKHLHAGNMLLLTEAARPQQLPQLYGCVPLLLRHHRRGQRP